MKHKTQRYVIGDGVGFTSISDPKFKHNRLSIHFVLPLDKDTATENAILPFLMRKGCKSCPDFSALNARLDELYGATIGVDVLKFNAYQILSLTIRSLDKRYALEGEDLTGDCARLLADIALEPNFDSDGLFPESDLELERRYLIDCIESEINEKRAYAISQCVQHMCEGEPVAVRRYGYIDKAEIITPQSAKSAWERVIGTARIEILFIGCGDPLPVKEELEKRFKILERSPLPCEFVPMNAAVSEVREHTEKMEVSQSKLVMGMRCSGVDSKSDVDAARIFTAMFGATPFSKLFLNVREKLSLCYYCAARFDQSTNLLIVDSGIEADKVSAARDEIMAQLSAMSRGDFDDAELNNTLLLMENSVVSTGDSLASLESWYLGQVLRGQDVSPDEDVENLRRVTREQVIDTAKRVSLDTVYFLTVKEEA